MALWMVMELRERIKCAKSEEGFELNQKTRVAENEEQNDTK